MFNIEKCLIKLDRHSPVSKWLIESVDAIVESYEKFAVSCLFVEARDMDLLWTLRVRWDDEIDRTSMLTTDVDSAEKNSLRPEISRRVECRTRERW